MQSENSVVGQSKRRHSESAARAQLERPPREQLVELLVDVRMPDQVAGWIDLQDRFDHRGFTAGESGIDGFFRVEPLLGLRRSEKLQKPLIVPLLHCGSQLLNLRQSMRQDFRLQCLPRRMFQEGVTGLEFPRLRYLADTEDNRSTIRSRLELSSL